jgi:hypothetical protein
MDPPPVDSISPSTLAYLAREDQGPRTIGLVVTFTVLGFVTVCLRFYARFRFAIHIGWEDHFIVVSMVSLLPLHDLTIVENSSLISCVQQIFAILSAACQIMQVHWGFGKHQTFVDLPSTIHAMKVRRLHIFACFELTLQHSTSISVSFAMASALRSLRFLS